MNYTFTTKEPITSCMQCPCLGQRIKCNVLNRRLDFDFTNDPIGVMEWCPLKAEEGDHDEPLH